MLLEHQDARKLGSILAGKMLERRSLAEWRKLAYEAKDISCGDPYAHGNECLSGADYTRALNRMHFAVNGVRPYAEGGGGGSGGSEEEHTGSTPPEPCSYGVCPEIIPGQGYVCQEFSETCPRMDHPFTCCSPFTCNPPNSGQFICEGFFECHISFTCLNGRFDDDEECGIFTCVPDNVYHCAVVPY